MQTRSRFRVGPVLAEKLGRHEIVANLGRGGMAEVFLAVRRGPYASNKLVVIKKLKGDASDDPQWLDMFVDEARIAMRLSHPNVVSTFDFVAEEDDFYLTMEFLDGQSLLQTLKTVGREKFPLELHIWILTQVLAGLAYAHELREFNGTPLGIVHRDVTPSNVILTYGGDVKLVDFGIAKVAGAIAVTQNGTMKGKIGYASREQCLGEATTARSDLYSVGIMLWEAIAGKRRTMGETPAAVYQARIAGTERLLEDVRPDIPPLLTKIVRRAVATSPEDRYQSAYEFQRELEQYLATGPMTYGTRALSEFMNLHFAQAREAMHRTIESGIAGVKAGAPDRGAGVSETITVTHSGIPGGVPPETGSDASVPPVGVSKSLSALAAPAMRRRGTKLAIAAVGLTGVSLVAHLALRGPSRGDTSPATVGTAPASVRSPTLSLPGAAAARREATAPAAQPTVFEPLRTVAPASEGHDLVSVRVFVKPRVAKMRVLFDGQPMSGNPFASRAHKDGATHTIAVKAPGYAVVERVITLDGDVRLTIKLERGVPDEPARRVGADEGGAGARVAAAGRLIEPAAPSLAPSASEEQPGMELRRTPRPGRGARPIDEKDPYTP